MQPLTAMKCSAKHTRSRKLFAGGLAPHVNADILESYFSQWGEIERVDVIPNIQRGYGHTGYAYITFKDNSSAAKVLQSSTSHTLPLETNSEMSSVGSVSIDINGPEELRKCLITDLPGKTQERALKKTMTLAFGEVAAISIECDSMNWSCEGLGFVTFTTKEAADRAARTGRIRFGSTLATIEATYPLPEKPFVDFDLPRSRSTSSLKFLRVSKKEIFERPPSSRWRSATESYRARKMEEQLRFQLQQQVEEMNRADEEMLGFAPTLVLDNGEEVAELEPDIPDGLENVSNQSGSHYSYGNSESVLSAASQPDGEISEEPGDEIQPGNQETAEIVGNSGEDPTDAAALAPPPSVKYDEDFSPSYGGTASESSG